MKRKLVCFDMDMTLFNHRTMTIPETALAGVKRLKEKGHLVVLASGRDFDTPFSEGLKAQIEPDAVVHTNGQKVTIQDKVLKEVLMDNELLQQLLDFSQEKDICLGTNIGEKGCFVNHEVVIAHEKKLFGHCDREFITPSNLLKESVYALTMCGTPEDAEKLRTAFPELKVLMFAGGTGADVVVKEASKAQGIEVLLEHYEMGWEEVVAFGDSANDLEMLSCAGLGIAMGNSVPGVKEVSDYVTADIAEDGILKGLIYAGLIEEGEIQND